MVLLVAVVVVVYVRQSRAAAIAAGTVPSSTPRTATTTPGAYLPAVVPVPGAGVSHSTTLVAVATGALVADAPKLVSAGVGLFSAGSASSDSLFSAGGLNETTDLSSVDTLDAGDDLAGLDDLADVGDA